MRNFLIVLTAVAVIGCENAPVNKGGQIGAAVGAVGGGLIGYQFGGGMGQVAYTVIGTLAGGFGGMVIGQKLDASDRAEYRNNAENALNAHPDGGIATWSNGKTGNGGIFSPTRTFLNAEGRYCRDFRATTAFRGGLHKETGTLCLDPRGQWVHMGGKVG